MTKPERSRSQRLKDCEKVLYAHLEDFVHVGMALAEIRDDRLYREDGHKSWSDYLKANKERFGITGRSYANEVIAAARLRQSLPLPEQAARGGLSWTEKSVRPLKKLGSTSKAKHVAKKAIEEAEKSGKPLTSTLVRKHVDAELGIDRSKLKPKEPPPMFEDVILRWTGDLERMAMQIQDVTPDALVLFAKNHPAKAKALAAAIETLEKSLTRVWESLP